MEPRDHIVGSLLGTAVGDAIGLPYEGVSKGRARKMLGEPDRHRFIGRRGMVSDDTELSCATAQALIASAGEPDAFARRLAWGLRWWLAGLPAGVGLATLRAAVKLWLGFPPSRSGVYSAGNGPAMRSAIIGASAGDVKEIHELVRAAARVTHTDPKAEHGAFAVAYAAFLSRAPAPVDPRTFLISLGGELRDESAREILVEIEKCAASVSRGESTEAFAESIGQGKGVSGYVNHTVPVALHAWLRHPRDFRAAVIAIVRCGGDTDTTAAIVGGIVGSAVGRAGIPAEWLDGLVEWPRTVPWMERLGDQLARVMDTGAPQRPPRLFAPAVLARNIVFLVVVLLHGLRRIFPPW